MARYKRAAGLPLTDQERRLLQEEARKYAACKIAIHCPVKDKQKWRRLADEKGTSLSAWIREQVTASLQPAAGQESLRRENSELRDEITTLRSGVGDLTRENAQHRQLLQECESELTELLASHLG